MFDPVSLCMQSSVFWMRVFKMQHDAYLRALGAFAANIPHEDSVELAREAEAMKQMLSPSGKTGRSGLRKSPANKPRASKAEMVVA